MGVGRNTPTPAARPPARPVIGLGGASARPGEREGPRGRREAQAGRGERAGRSRRGAGARVPGIAERAWGGRESQRRGREPGGLSAEWREKERERWAKPPLGAFSKPPVRASPQPSGRKRRRGRVQPHLPALPRRAAQKDRGSRPRDVLQPVAASRTPRGVPAPWRPGSGNPSTDFRKRR